MNSADLLYKVTTYYQKTAVNRWSLGFIATKHLSVFSQVFIYSCLINHHDLNVCLIQYAKSNLPSNAEPDQDILFTFKHGSEYVADKKIYINQLLETTAASTKGI